MLFVTNMFSLQMLHNLSATVDFQRLTLEGAKELVSKSKWDLFGSIDNEECAKVVRSQLNVDKNVNLYSRNNISLMKGDSLLVALCKVDTSQELTVSRIEYWYLKVR